MNELHHNSQTAEPAKSHADARSSADQRPEAVKSRSNKGELRSNEGAPSGGNGGELHSNGDGEPGGQELRRDAVRRVVRLWGRHVLGQFVRHRWLPGYGVTFDQRFAALPRQERDKLRRRPLEAAELMFLALLTGGAAGVAAALLKWAIALVSTLLTGRFNPVAYNFWLILLPVTGILLAGMFQRYLLRRPIFHGEYRIHSDLRANRCYLPVELTYAPLLAATVTLGFGGSAGSEGPIAYSGAAIGSNIGSFFRVAPSKERVLMAIGAGAGIAGIFKAPIGGALFTLEVLGVTMTTIGVVAVVIACVASALTAYLLSGCTPDIPFAHPVEVALDNVPLVLLFAVLCGVYSYFYSGLMGVVGRRLRGMRNPWVRNLVAGCGIGLMLFCFPGLYGEGYGLVGKLLAGDWQAVAAGGLGAEWGCAPWVLLAVAGGMMLCKPAATSATNNGGGVAGDFAPTIMIGSVVGFFYAYLLDGCLGMQIAVADYVFMGMAGILAGACSAPLMAMFLVTEMATMGYGQFMPVAIVATISYLTVCGLRLLSVRRWSPGRRRAC